MTQSWMEDYNQNHPHESLRTQRPNEYAVKNGKLGYAQDVNPQFTTINSNNDDKIFFHENNQPNELYTIFNPS